MIKSIAIYKPEGVVTFDIGATLMMGKEKTLDTVKKIELVKDGTVKITISNKAEICFKGFPISYEQ